jgi:Rieske Fe-S protein
MVAAAILGDAIGGRRHFAAGLFDATRLTANVGRDLVRTNAAVAQRYVADRVLVPERPGRVAAGSGAVVREGGRLVAVARSADGTEHRLDARCSHLGCIVRYNAGEFVWDCPCHGSRFALDGTVLDGPAVRPLNPAGPQRG